MSLAPSLKLRNLGNIFFSVNSFLPYLRLSTNKFFTVLRLSIDLIETLTKHFIFWLCNMKQLNFWHFNTNSKKFFETVFFFQKEAEN